MAKYNNFIMTKEFLDENENAVFVFGDNLIHKGYGGAAILRDHPQAYGFITKKYPSNDGDSFYGVHEYRDVFKRELMYLENDIKRHKNKTFYVSQLGGGLANRYKIWELVIKRGLEYNLGKYENVVFLWDE
jgi:hypothetical protein